MSGSAPITGLVLVTRKRNQMEMVMFETRVVTAVWLDLLLFADRIFRPVTFKSKHKGQKDLFKVLVPGTNFLIVTGGLLRHPLSDLF